MSGLALIRPTGCRTSSSRSVKRRWTPRWPGTPPAGRYRPSQPRRASVNFGAWDGLDFHDVPLVDGSNLPMWINITRSSGGTTDKVSPNGCVAAGCTKQVTCPSVLDVKSGAAVVGCISACARLGRDQYCCRGQYASRSPGDPAQWPVGSAAVVKRAEPYAYSCADDSYADDDATSFFTCSGVCDYRVTFGCTPGDG